MRLSVRLLHCQENETGSCRRRVSGFPRRGGQQVARPERAGGRQAGRRASACPRVSARRGRRLGRSLGRGPRAAAGRAPSCGETEASSPEAGDSDALLHGREVGSPAHRARRRERSPCGTLPASDLRSVPVKGSAHPGRALPSLASPGGDLEEGAGKAPNPELGDGEPDGPAARPRGGPSHRRFCSITVPSQSGRPPGTRPESGKQWRSVGHGGLGADRGGRAQAEDPESAGDGVSGERPREGRLLSRPPRLSLGPRPRRPPLEPCGSLGARADALSKVRWGPSGSRDAGAAGAGRTAVGENG